MKNYQQPGITVTVPSPGDINGGAVVVIGSLVGVAAGTVATGAPLDITTRGVFTLPKVATDVVAVGAPLYLASGLITVDADGGSNPFVGVAVAAAGNPSASVAVLIGGGQSVTIINS